MSIDFVIERSESISDVKIITPSVHDEFRGSIWTSYNNKISDHIPEGMAFKHDKFSSSKQNVLRGIHGDHKSWKLVSCIYGNILQVVIDLRKDSSSYLKHLSFELGDNDRRMILIPPGLGNAFYVKSELAIYHYKLAYTGEYTDADKQFTMAWNDPIHNIDWPTDSPILSERDKGNNL